jgi:predicted Zn-dependent protease
MTKRTNRFSFSIRGAQKGESVPGLSELQQYLQRLGYLKGGFEPDTLDEKTSDAIQQYQANYGLKVTGEADEATITELEQPRCGVPDVAGVSTALAEFVLRGCNYDRATLTYRFENTTADLTAADQRTAVRNAFATWSREIPVDFVEVGANQTSNFTIGWHTGNHGDGSAFDGPGTTLAHAFYPPPCGGQHSGEMHFDDAETWALNQGANQFDLETVSLHEIGHLLGLAHSDVAEAVMFANYGGQRRILSADDIQGIQQLYGARHNNGEFYTTDGSGNIILLRRYPGWRKDWTLIIPGNFGGSNHTDLLFYDRTARQGEFYTTNGLGGISRLILHNGWRQTWSIIVPGNFGGNTRSDLLFYDPTTGQGEFYTTDGNGNIQRLGSTHQGWRQTWSMIIPGNFGGSSRTDLLFYDPTTGQGEFYTTDGNGNIRRLGNTHQGWRQTWSMIIPGNFGGSSFTDLLFYDPTTGEGEFYTTDGNGNIRRLGNTHQSWRQTWSMIIPGNFGGSSFTDLLFYDPTTGQGEFYTTDGNGNISRLGNTHQSWRRTWSMIIPGNFGGSSFTDLLFYERG